MTLDTKLILYTGHKSLLSASSCRRTALRCTTPQVCDHYNTIYHIRHIILYSLCRGSILSQSTMVFRTRLKNIFFMKNLKYILFYDTWTCFQWIIPTAVHWADSVIEFVCLDVCAIRCSFFLGLSLARLNCETWWKTPQKLRIFLVIWVHVFVCQPGFQIFFVKLGSNWFFNFVICVRSKFSKTLKVTLETPSARIFLKLKLPHGQKISLRKIATRFVVRPGHDG